MRNGKMTLNLKIEDRKGIVLGLVVPFILFWAGILSPLYTDNFLVWIFSLAPFYGYVFGYVTKHATFAIKCFDYNIVFSVGFGIIFLNLFFDCSIYELFVPAIMLCVNIVNSFMLKLCYLILEDSKDPSKCPAFYTITPPPP